MISRIVSLCKIVLVGSPTTVGYCFLNFVICIIQFRPATLSLINPAVQDFYAPQHMYALLF